MKLSKTIRKYFAVIFLTHISLNMAHPVVPTLFKRLDFPDYMYGVQFACLSLVVFLLSPQVKRLYTYMKKNQIIAAGVGFFALIQLGYANVRSVWQVVLIRAGAGVCNAGFLVGYLAYFFQITKKEERPRLLACQAAVSAVAECIGYYAGGFLGNGNIKVTFYVQCALCLISAAANLFFLTGRAPDTSPDSDAADGEKTERDKITGDGAFRDETGEAEAKGRKTGTAGGICGRGTALLFFSAAAAAGAAYNCQSNAMDYYIRDFYDLNPIYNGMVRAGLGLVALISNFTLGVWIGKKLRSDRAVTAVFLLCAAMLLPVCIKLPFLLFVAFHMFYYIWAVLYRAPMQNLIAVLRLDAPGGDGFGRYMSFEALGQIIGSLSSGALYGIYARLPFIASAALFGLAAFMTAALIRIRPCPAKSARRAGTR